MNNNSLIETGNSEWGLVLRFFFFVFLFLAFALWILFSHDFF